MKILARLSEADGVAGDEQQVRKLIREFAEPHSDDMRVDALGNLMVTRSGDPDLPAVMIAAHMDEVGLMISHIQKNGLLKFYKVGGIDDRVLPSSVVRIGEDKVAGVIGAKPVHAQKPSEWKKVIPYDKMFIDIGAQSEDEAQKKVKPGDYAAFATEFGEMGDGRLKGKAFDDRAGCAMLLEILSADHSVPLQAVFTVQEEIGLRGSQVAAWDLKPDLALVFEGTTCADIPESEEHGYSTTMGEGPAISIMDRTSVAHRGIVSQLVKLAEENDVPFQFRRSTAGGNDAGPIHLTREGIPTATVSTPCRYIHSPVSVLKESDFENGVRLIELFLQSIERGFRP